MPSHSASGDPPSYGRIVGQLSASAFPASEWELLTRLPGRVIVAATSAEAHSPRRTVAEGLAGLDAIAAGRAFDSDLVRAVVAAIYAESDEDRPVAEELVHRAAGLAEVLAACREATQVLAGRADPADSAAYRQWVQSIAARVCATARFHDLLGQGGEQVGPAERRFLEELGVALGLR